MAEGVDIYAPPDWCDAVERVVDRGIRRAMVLGAVDVGKSTFCRFLAEKARARGRTAALLDIDVGQKTVGPPACVTLDESTGSKLAFVGVTDPIRGWRRVVDGARRLADGADSDLLIANTSGLLAGPGRRLKAAKIEAVRPDLLITIGDGPDLESILNDHAAVPALHLTPSPEARRKTDAARRAARQSAFRSYFAQAAVRPFARTFVLEALQGQLQAGVLVGLADARETDLGLGVLLGDPRPATLDILTPVAADAVCRIEPGALRLRENFSQA